MKLRSNIELSNYKIHTYGGLRVYLESISRVTLVDIK
jgi:hypothetical protein